MTAYLAAHPYASAVELAGVRAAERGQDPHTVPYFDLTVSAVKSVSVLHASYRVSARQARERGEEDQAAALDARADEIEDALMDSAWEALGWLERHATYTRTGHHSSRTGEWRDGDGLVASLFLHHLSRDGDPQLHVHVAIWNRVQRADGADGKWRTLDSRTLHTHRLGVAPAADREMETRLTALGYAMVPRADGNGAEVGGVSQDVMDLFSSRAVAVTGELKRLAQEYEDKYGKPPSRRTLWLLHQQAGQNTRRTKNQARRTIAGQTGTTEPTAAQRLAAWEAQTVRREVRALSAVHEQVAQYAKERTAGAAAALDDAAKRTAARIAVAEVQRHHAVWSMAPAPVRSAPGATQARRWHNWAVRYPADHVGLEILPPDECLRLLASVPVGRVGFVADGEVVVLPVNHVVDGQDVIFRTAHGSKLAAAEGQNRAAFEADHYNEQTQAWWSVLVNGRAEVMDAEADIERLSLSLSRLGVYPWVTAMRHPFWIRIRPASVSGRRTPGTKWASHSAGTLPQPPDAVD